MSRALPVVGNNVKSISFFFATTEGEFLFHFSVARVLADNVSVPILGGHKLWCSPSRSCSVPGRETKRCSVDDFATSSADSCIQGLVAVEQKCRFIYENDYRVPD